jgi:hypothetical protein
LANALEERLNTSMSGLEDTGGFELVFAAAIPFFTAPWKSIDDTVRNV